MPDKKPYVSTREEKAVWDEMGVTEDQLNDENFLADDPDFKQYKMPTEDMTAKIHDAFFADSTHPNISDDELFAGMARRKTPVTWFPNKEAQIEYQAYLDKNGIKL